MQLSFCTGGPKRSFFVTSLPLSLPLCLCLVSLTLRFWWTLCRQGAAAGGLCESVFSAGAIEMLSAVSARDWQPSSINQRPRQTGQQGTVSVCVCVCVCVWWIRQSQLLLSFSSSRVAWVLLPAELLHSFSSVETLSNPHSPADLRVSVCVCESVCPCACANVCS